MAFFLTNNSWSIMRLCIFIIIFFLNTSFTLHAQDKSTFVPKSNDYIVAKWHTIPFNSNVLEQIKALLEQAKYMGNSNNYAKASVLLKQLKAGEISRVQRLYYEAVIKQYYHHFTESLILLDQVLQIDAKHVNARFMSANLYAVLGDFNVAKKRCASLVGLVEPLLVAACTLNIDAQQGSTSSTPKALKTLSDFSNKHPSNMLSVSIYVAEIKASMATYLNQYELAQSTLSPFIEQQAPLSFWVLWSDIQLALAQPNKVLATVGPMVTQTTNQDDALLLRLAIAEKAANGDDSAWFELIQKRVELREVRQDEEHAFDIALYYLHLESKPEKALHWAKINWQQAKLKEDARLLKTASRLFAAKNKHIDLLKGDQE